MSSPDLNTGNASSTQDTGLVADLDGNAASTMQNVSSNVRPYSLSIIRSVQLSPSTLSPPRLYPSLLRLLAYGPHRVFKAVLLSVHAFFACPRATLSFCMDAFGFSQDCPSSDLITDRMVLLNLVEQCREP